MHVWRLTVPSNHAGLLKTVMRWFLRLPTMSRKTAMSQQSRHRNCRSLSCASRKKCKKKSRSVDSVLRCVSFIQRTNDYAWSFVHSSPRLQLPLLTQRWQQYCSHGLRCPCRCTLRCSSMRCQTLSMPSSCQHTCLASLRQSVSSYDVPCITSGQA